tara:strand:+ start:832 stop:1032 length:201 start_codon:yes stop_codon:yes gene_type:complete
MKEVKKVEKKVNYWVVKMRIPTEKIGNWQKFEETPLVKFDSEEGRDNFIKEILKEFPGTEYIKSVR